MLINGERALAYVTQVDEVKPIPGYDRVVHVRVGGWWVVSSINDGLKPGDKCVYFEIDSLVNSADERFAFLESKKYKIKTQKMCKVYSEGLVMPVSAFPELGNPPVGKDVTKALKVTYYVPEDNQRKSSSANPAEREKRIYQRMARRHPRLANTKLFRSLMKTDAGKKFLLLIFGNIKDKDTRFPRQFQYIHVTDEERVENMPYILEDKEPWIKTTKIDGTSTTFILEKKSFGKFEEYVCSRNVRQLTPEQPNYHTGTSSGECDNVYWEMAYKYNIFDFLKEYLKANELEYVCLQGETAGVSLQGNPHKFPDRRFFGFNLIRSDTGRVNSVEAAEICSLYDIPWVPIVDTNYILPDDFEEFKQSADGPCEAPDSQGLREGYVYRSLDGKRSFKNVSRQYMMKH